MNDVLAHVFPSRIEAIKILRSGAASAEAIREAAAQASEAAEEFGRAEAAQDWRAFADALDTIALLVDWEKAVRGAERDADRFLRAARLRYQEWANNEGLTTFGRQLAKRIAVIESEMAPNAVATIRGEVALLPMPIAVFNEPDLRGRFPHPQIEPKPTPEDVAVAFLEFAIDGRPAETLHSLSAGQVHDLDLTIRVSRWPEEAERLAIAPISIEPASMWEFPTFEFVRPEGPPPYVFQRQGRMRLHASQGFNARPLEFRYAAQFQPEVTWNQRVLIAGQRTLRLDGTDTSRHAVTGYGEIDAKIIVLREKLRIEPLVSEQDVQDLLVLLAAIGNLMGQAVQDKRYPDPINELAFQRDFQSFLRANSAIGAELEVQPHVTGGRTDLSFRGIRIELKSEPTTRLLPGDCRQYAEQAASYAVGTGRRVAILCVLDCSRKREMPFPVADGLTIFPVETGTSPIYVVTCLLQGGLPRPSDLSP